MSKFKVGERYKVSGTISRNGNIIEITAVDENHYSYKTIEGNDHGNNYGFDENSMMGNGLIPIPHSRYELHITCTDGKTTNVVYKVNGEIKERKQAVCNPCDDFQFDFGANVALNRIFPKPTIEVPPTPQPQPEDKPRFVPNSKVKCIRTTETYFTVGKVYDINADGRITDDVGFSFTRNKGETSAEWLKMMNVASFEPYTEPEQPKEPIKLYCVKDYKALLSPMFTRGKIYETDENEQIKADSGLTTYRKWNSDKMKKEFPEMFASLIPLVKRPAVVGEWVLIVNAQHTKNHYKNGDLMQIVESHADSTDCPHYRDQFACWLFEDEYLVLDNYHPEPEKEPEPEYYSGVAVCIENGGKDYSVGMSYEIKDGFLYNNSGNRNPLCSGAVVSIEDLNSRSDCKFIPYLGESPCTN